ncbi:hypothetical protein EMMF5_002638 [Cystobasidiomycetes sp. EMM_F5]
MFFGKKVIAPLALVASVAASPIEKRASYDDATILNYALTLEHLEAAFYRVGLQMYNAGAFQSAGYADWVRYRFTEIANQEATHVSFLTTALKGAGANPVAECTYNFGSLTPATYVATSQVLEGVGVAAYLGAAPAITNKAYLAVAGSILVVEAEHETWVRAAASNQDGFPRPFAAYLDFNQVYTLAAPFIKSCPSSNPTLPFKTFPSITVNTAGPYSQGQKISITVPKGLSGTVYAVFVDTTAPQYQQIDYSSGTATVTIPNGIKGQSYLVLTNSNKAFNDAATVAGPAIVFINSPATSYAY